MNDDHAIAIIAAILFASDRIENEIAVSSGVDISKLDISTKNDCIETAREFLQLARARAPT